MAGDLARESKGFWEWAPPRSLLASIRSYQRWRGNRWPWGLIARRIAVFRHIFWSVVTASDISINAKIGHGLSLPHPAGVVIHQDAEIGPDCLILSGVTIGLRSGSGVPVLGTHVDVGTGAKILGAIRIGDHAIIGAGAVVIGDVAAGATVVGVPAREISHPQRIIERRDAGAMQSSSSV